MRAITKSLEKELTNSFSFDAEDYIKRHGLVTDKETAIKLLCETNRAWEALDESLKLDPEVIMYLQPTGLKEYCLRTPYNGYLNLIDLCATGEIFYYENSFECIDSAELIKNCYISLESGLCDDAFLLPKITFPEDFDFEAYLKIQTALKSQNPYVERNGNLKVGIEAIVNTFFTAMKMSGCGLKVSETTTIFDRNLLKALVPAMYKTKSKTIGTHPAMQSKTTSEN